VRVFKSSRVPKVTNLRRPAFLEGIIVCSINELLLVFRCNAFAVLAELAAVKADISDAWIESCIASQGMEESEAAAETEKFGPL
jgi:hypothetical protein